MIRADALRADTDASENADPAATRVIEAQTIDSIITTLPDGTALLQYVTGSGGESTSAFVITGSGINAYVLTPIDSLKDDIERFMTLTGEGAGSGNLARRLSSALLQAPLDGLSSDIGRLVIVPDGALHRLAFDALQLSDGSFVVERYAVSLAPSATVARELWNRRRDATTAPILSFGDAAFPEDSGSGVTAVYYRAFGEEGGLPRLRASRREAKAVGGFSPEAEVRLGSNASEAYLKSAALDRFRVIHFATHARVDEWAVTRTALALSPGDGEDGFVGAGDLAALNLDADLVVLSACRTVSGRVIRGEGVQGLTAPLLQAGARAVVATAWPIRDRSAARFVEDFYRGAASGLSVGDALRQAKLAALSRDAPIAEWAAFTLVGDSEVRLALHRDSSWSRYWWLLVVIAFGLGGYAWSIARRRRGVTGVGSQTSR
jgi:hypothetical protein